VRYYLDTSALVKLYIQEDGTAAMLDLLGDGDHTVVVLALTRVEVHAALARRLRSNEVTAEQFQEVTDRLAEHWYSHFLVQPVTDALLNEAINLLERHPLSAYDAIQLAGCMVCRSGTTEPPVFVCSDNSLIEAARNEDFTCLNPLDTPIGPRRRSGIRSTSA
jgi:predicted nucleic acid-binding protein